MNIRSEVSLDSAGVPVAQSLEIEVLGPVSIRLGGESILPTAGKPRQVLTLLALRHGRAIPVGTLMEEVWGSRIPRSGASTLQSYIVQLRRVIAESLPPDSPLDAKDLLTTEYTGYRLAARPSRFDVREFERIAALGDAALAVGDAAEASAHLTRALDEWRGPALMGVPAGRVLCVEAIGLEEVRMRVLEQRITADLTLGKQAMLIPELRVLVAENPMHENFCAMLMIAFHRSGAAWRALQAFRALRATLSEELGVEPSARMQRLHQEILAGESELSAAALVQLRISS